MACILKRKSAIAVSFIAAFLFLLVVRLVNEVNFPLLLNCFGQPGTKWIPFSYTYRRPLRTHYGYINVRTQEPLQLNCELCAIVSNSGQMVGQKVGNEIDRSSCIWRMNNAPTKGYEEDVGRMTMIRVVSHTSVPLLLKNPDYFFKEANTTIYVIWGPFRNMRKDGNGIVYNMLKKTVDVYPNAQIYVTTEKRMSYCDGIFKKETGKDRPLPLHLFLSLILLPFFFAVLGIEPGSTIMLDKCTTTELQASPLYFKVESAQLPRKTINS
ncbi:alpha-N-acetylgalactosaminide alpha-2,6-sialyltransferase 3 isoform X3 [Cavia porcellus]|uniref:alpha-N-acetylgalactosaminide alpha-2,6-sialyltransferase 3 isoform X3 n=1 Tax=Cavia porcellus TaxID=10141 RepID=UPI002FE0D223